MSTVTPVLDPTSPVGRAPERALARTSRAWAWSGLVAGVAALATMILSGALAVETDDLVDNARVAAALDGTAWAVWANQVLTVLTALATLVFAAGLRRRLAEQEPVGSLIPQVASAGLLTAAVMSLVGGGISTEMFHSLRHVDETDPDTLSAQLMIFDTMGWVWAGVGLAAAAVGLGALRNGSAGRAIGWFSVVIAVLVGVTQVLPFQYLALPFGALWLVVASIGFVREARVQSRPE
jgi:hypothetical protein